jgi:hypothetical protein
MSRLIPARALTLASLAVAAVAVAGCGKTGELQRPAPLFGHPAAGAQGQQGREPSRPVDTVDPRNAAITPAPPRTNPLEGTSPDPTASGPPTALPDPYANPRQ